MSVTGVRAGRIGNFTLGAHLEKNFLIRVLLGLPRGFVRARRGSRLSPFDALTLAQGALGFNPGTGVWTFAGSSDVADVVSFLVQKRSD